MAIIRDIPGGGSTVRELTPRQAAIVEDWLDMVGCVVCKMFPDRELMPGGGFRNTTAAQLCPEHTEDFRELVDAGPPRTKWC